MYIYNYIYIHTHNHIYIFNECVYILLYNIIYIYLYHIMLGFQALKKHNWLCSWYPLSKRLKGPQVVAKFWHFHSPQQIATGGFHKWGVPQKLDVFLMESPPKKMDELKVPHDLGNPIYIYIYILCIWIGADRQPPKYMVWSQKGDETTTPLLTTRVSCFNLCECEPNI